MSARSTQISYLCFLLLFSFSAANATEWHKFERDGLALHLAHNDAVRARELLNALLIGRNEIRRKLGGTPEIPITVYLAPSEAAFRELTHGRLPHWSAGVAFLESRTIVLQAGTDNLLQVARHEFAHIFLHAIASSSRTRLVSRRRGDVGLARVALATERGCVLRGLFRKFNPALRN